MVQISSYNYVNNQIVIFMELKLIRIFKPLGIALSETNRLYEYRVVQGKRGQKLYVKRIKPVFDNGIAELYRFKRGDKTFVFVIDKGKSKYSGRQLIFDNWPSGQSIFAMLMDDVIMVANRINDSTKIDCSCLHFIKTYPLRRVVKLTGPKDPVAPEQIIYEGKVLSVGKQHFLPTSLSNADFNVQPITEWEARNLRHRAFVKQDRAKWIAIPLQENYDL